MSDDLVKQLRRNFTDKVSISAADRIEQLEAELHSCFHRIEELQAALREIIVHFEVQAPPNAEALKMFARKALEGKDE